MERRMREKNDRISELPVFLLHRILSYLPRKDAALTSVLSKRWNSVWHSFPILKFAVTDYIKERYGTPEFAEKFEKFLNLVDKSLQNFTQNKLRIEVFYLNMSLTDDKYIPMVNAWIPLALHNGASRISFWVGRASGDDYPFPETTFDVKSISGSSRFYRLQKLDLTMVYLSENMVRDIIRNCPNISDLCISFFHGLKSLEISKLEKLKKLSIGVAPDVREIECLSVDGPLLENFEFVSFEPKLPCVIKLISCHALKCLRLITCAITDDLLSSYMSTSPLLEHLHVNDCHMLRRIRIFGQRLKSLELYKCNELEVVQIHAPNLSRFKFISHKNMPILFPENVIPCSVHVHYHIRSTNGPIDSFWFLKMREFLGVSARGVIFSLLVLDNEVISFHPEALRDVAIPQLVNVDLLEISSSRILSEFDCDTLLDGLLWCCHPKEISIRLDSVFQSNCIKVLCEKLVGMEQPLCCQLSQIKCWRHSFKSVKIDNLEATKDDRLLHPNYFLNSFSSFDEEGQEVRFVLDWDL